MYLDYLITDGQYQTNVLTPTWMKKFPYEESDNSNQIDVAPQSTQKTVNLMFHYKCTKITSQPRSVKMKQ